MREGATVSQEFVKCLHLLSDNRPLSRSEYAAIEVGLGQIAQLHRDYRGFVAAEGLDPDIFLPGGLWADLYGLDSCEQWTYDLVNIVKCLSPLFTGFDTLAFEQRDHPRVNRQALERLYTRLMTSGVVPSNIESLLQQEFELRTRLWLSRYLIEAHADLVRGVPSRYIARCPDRMGEIGIVHEGAILNPDLLTYQARINAMLGGGVLPRLEKAIEERGFARVLEIGPGLCFIPSALQQAFAGKLKFVLIDLPQVMARGYAYLAGVTRPDDVAVVTTTGGGGLPEAPFVFLANYMVPAWDEALPQFDVVYNAISMNEMNAAQVAFYLDLIDRHLAADGVFFLEQGEKYADGQEDAMAAARLRFPNHECRWDRSLDGVQVMATPNSFFYANAPICPL